MEHNNIILDRGINTSSLYSLICGLCYHRSECINKILNTDPLDVRIEYLQEFIKEKFCKNLQVGKSITLKIINRFRYILIAYGYIKRYTIDNMLENHDPVNLFQYIFSDNMSCGLSFERVNIKLNSVENVLFPMIELNTEKDSNNNSNNNVPNRYNMSNMIENWINRNLVSDGVNNTNENYLYKFKNIPYIVPISINHDFKTPIDVMHSINFNNIGDVNQKIFAWEIHCLILYDKSKQQYLSMVRSRNDVWNELSENTIPSNKIIDMSDPFTVNKISRQIIMAIYKVN